MEFPKDVRYTKDHEWVRISGDTALVGITDYAQGELGDIVFVELPARGRKVKRGESMGTSCKRRGSPRGRMESTPRRAAKQASDGRPSPAVFA